MQKKIFKKNPPFGRKRGERIEKKGREKEWEVRINGRITKKKEKKCARAENRTQILTATTSRSAIKLHGLVGCGY